MGVMGDLRAPQCVLFAGKSAEAKENEGVRSSFVAPQNSVFAGKSAETIERKAIQGVWCGREKC